MQKVSALAKLLALPAIIIILVQILNIIGNAYTNSGGIVWYYLVLYLVTGFVVMAAAFGPALHHKLKLLAVGLLAISIATLPTDISLGFDASHVEGDDRVLTGGKLKAAGLIITIVMMYIALAQLSLSLMTHDSAYDYERDPMYGKTGSGYGHGTTATGAGTAYNSRTDLPSNQNHVGGNQMSNNPAQRNVVELS